MKKYVLCFAFALAFSSILFAQAGGDAHDPQFSVSSNTFSDGGTLPLSMVLGSNNCQFVTGGGNQSPQLSWTHAPGNTRSFVVTMFDTTASFTHWGMYNIPATTHELPVNAGVAGSTFGQQVFNDFFLGPEYDGPCPPNNLAPLVHEYVFTVYALDTELNLQSSPPNFPADAETLYRALLGHVLRQATIHGFFSSAN
jgi:Raf kinase inhibitor-like YbhB/YbcL family protein